MVQENDSKYGQETREPSGIVGGDLNGLDLQGYLIKVKKKKKSSNIEVKGQYRSKKGMLNNLHK